jgi:hypothetical protein
MMRKKQKRWMDANIWFQYKADITIHVLVPSYIFFWGGEEYFFIVSRNLVHHIQNGIHQVWKRLRRFQKMFSSVSPVKNPRSMFKSYFGRAVQIQN